MRFLIDAQLPPGLVQHLEASGHSAEHVNFVGLGAAADGQVWAYAVRVGAVLISKDQDFARLAKARPEGVPVVWIRLGNTTNHALWVALKPAIPEIVGAVAAGEKLVEVT